MRVRAAAFADEKKLKYPYYKVVYVLAVGNFLNNIRVTSALLQYVLACSLMARFP